MKWPLVRYRVSIALAPNRLAAVLPGGRVLETEDVSDLGQAVRDLRVGSGLARASVDVALVPPLVDVRVVKLPPMKDAERLRIVERDASRYFVGMTEPVVIGTTASPAGVFAAAVSSELLAQVESAIMSVGWALGTVIPAPFAWSAGLADGQVAVVLEQGVEVLQVRRHRLVERRRHRVAPAGVPLLQEPVAAAARHASVPWAPELVSNKRRGVRTQVTKRVMIGFFAATAALLLLAAGLDYWGLSRRLVSIEAHRAALAPAVSRAIATNDSLATLVGGLGTLQGLTQSNRRWSAFLADLADFLPRDAHLVGLRVSGDSATLEGIAGRSAGVFDALEEMPSITGLRAAAPIQRDVQADGSVREHFAFDATLTEARGHQR